MLGGGLGRRNQPNRRKSPKSTKDPALRAGWRCVSSARAPHLAQTGSYVKLAVTVVKGDIHSPKRQRLTPSMLSDPAGHPLSSTLWYQSLRCHIVCSLRQRGCWLCHLPWQSLPPPLPSLLFSLAGTLLLSCEKFSGFPCPRLSHACPALHPLTRICHLPQWAPTLASVSLCPGSHLVLTCWFSSGFHNNLGPQRLQLSQRLRHWV